MSKIEPTDEEVEAFKEFWREADQAGRRGQRVREGLRAVFKLREGQK